MLALLAVSQRSTRYHESLCLYVCLALLVFVALRTSIPSCGGGGVCASTYADLAADLARNHVTVRVASSSRATQRLLCRPSGRPSSRCPHPWWPTWLRARACSGTSQPHRAPVCGIRSVSHLVTAHKELPDPPPQSCWRMPPQRLSARRAASEWSAPLWQPFPSLRSPLEELGAALSHHWPFAEKCLQVGWRRPWEKPSSSLSK